MFKPSNFSPFTETQLSEDSFKELLPYFFEEIKEDFNQLINANKEVDLIEVKKIAHKIKGSAASYSAVLIEKRAWLLQECIDKNDTNQLDKIATELEKSIEASYLFAVHHFKIS